MSLARVTLLTIQAASNHLACTLPNPTPSTKGRYHMDELYILQVGPLIYKARLVLFNYHHHANRPANYQIHIFAVWLCLACEILCYIAAISPSFVHPLAPSTSLQINPLFLIGVLAVILGTYIRLDCFRTLGTFFTIDLAVHPQHKLVTSRFYAHVRHPSYMGSLLLVIGFSFSHLTQGSWVTSYGPLRIPGIALLVCALWWAWTLCVVIGRADAEDKMMRKLFGAEWEMYATQVPWSFFPGIM